MASLKLDTKMAIILVQTDESPTLRLARLISWMELCAVPILLAKETFYLSLVLIWSVVRSKLLDDKQQLWHSNSLVYSTGKSEIIPCS